MKNFVKVLWAVIPACFVLQAFYSVDAFAHDDEEDAVNSAALCKERPRVLMELDKRIRDYQEVIESLGRSRDPADRDEVALARQSLKDAQDMRDDWKHSC